MQPYLFPYIGYWQLIQAVDTFVIYDDVNYIMRGWINRNYILENGVKKMFTLETRDASQNRLINQVSVGENGGKLIKTITQNYRKAPNFQSVMGILSELLISNEKNLARFITSTIRSVCSYLMIDTKLIVSSEDFDNSNLRGANRIIDICQQLNADVYVNPIGGISLYNESNFANHGLQLYFIESNLIAYPQFSEGLFVPNLSIIDVMMFNSPEIIEGFLNNYNLV